MADEIPPIPPTPPDPEPTPEPTPLPPDLLSAEGLHWITPPSGDLRPRPQDLDEDWPIELSIRARQKPPHPGFWWSLLWCVFFLCTTQGPGIVLAVVLLIALALLHPAGGSLEALGKAGNDNAALLKMENMQITMLAVMALAELLVVGVSLLIIRLVVGRDWPRQLAVRRPGLAHLLLVLASFPAMLILANGAYKVVKDVLHLPSLGMDEFVQSTNSWPLVLAVLIIGLGPGIGEELWCRGFLGRGLVGRHGPLLGVLMTSFYFGLIHIDPAQGVTVMFMALWLHFVYLVTRSFWMPVLLHFLNNSTAVTMSHFSVGEDIDQGAVPVIAYISAAVLLAMVAWTLYQSRARLADVEEGPSWRPDYPGVAYPPADSGTRVVHPWPSWTLTGLTVLAVAQHVAVWIWF